MCVRAHASVYFFARAQDRETRNGTREADSPSPIKVCLGRRRPKLVGSPHLGGVLIRLEHIAALSCHRRQHGLVQLTALRGVGLLQFLDLLGLPFLECFQSDD